MGIIGSVLRQASNDALYMQIDKVIDGIHFVFTILVGISTDDRIAHLTRLCLNTIKHGRIIVSNQIRHHHAYDFGRFFTQTLGKGIGAII